MFKIIPLIVVTLLLASCSLMQTKAIAPNEKAFEDEDMYILFALRAEEVGSYKSASDIFTSIYQKSKKKEYLYRSIENNLAAKENEKVLQRVDAYLEVYPNDVKLLRLKVIALVSLDKLQEAKVIAANLAKDTQAANDYLLTSEIYIKLQKYDMAVRYLESAYAKKHDENILDKMSIILYVNLGKKKEAIAQLETHSRMIGCSQKICSRLIAFYSNDNNLDGILSTYLRLYEVNSNEEIRKKIIQIYSYKQDYKNLQIFLEKTGSDDAILLQLYSSKKEYKKAYPLADKLYAETSDINYLGQSAIFEYESEKGEKSKKLLDKVVNRLERVVDAKPDPLYLNYLGYILIDHDIDVKKGMGYITEVIKKQPNSSYYLDSLAWGYYKLSECKKAKELILKVEKLEGGDDPEVSLHAQEIEKCLNNKKVKK